MNVRVHIQLRLQRGIVSQCGQLQDVRKASSTQQSYRVVYVTLAHPEHVQQYARIQSVVPGITINCELLIVNMNLYLVPGIPYSSLRIVVHLSALGPLSDMGVWGCKTWLSSPSLCRPVSELIHVSNIISIFLPSFRPEYVTSDSIRFCYKHYGEHVIILVNSVLSAAILSDGGVTGITALPVVNTLPSFLSSPPLCHVKLPQSSIS